MWNQNAVKITGFDVEDVMGRNLVSEFITEDFRESVGKVLEAALSGDQTANYEFPLVTKDGRRLDILLNATTRRDDKNEVIGVIGIGQDISSRRAQEQEYV